ncbi:MAG: helix-turn-helix transcriptional regulator [Dinoroseobacter sp.]|nr:helix-turn-helix transcriptional regulator [Dinoroseobacter sp.]
MEKIDKRDRAAQFRQRLQEAVVQKGLSQARLARDIGVDRSTVSQLLGDEGARLPNAHVVGEAARALGVSADWLLGLSDRPETATDMMPTEIDMPEAPRTLVDEMIFGWHREAEGYKIRHVPATLPDMLKTRAVNRWEYAPTLRRSPDQAILAGEERLDWMRASRSDYEIALPLHEMSSFAHGNGYWEGVPIDVRIEQIDWLLTMHEQLYPTLRIFLFDAKHVFSAPITVFGPLMAVVYLGKHYMAFRDIERVQLITRQFDGLIQAADLSDRDWPDYLIGLKAQIT